MIAMISLNASFITSNANLKKFRQAPPANNYSGTQQFTPTSSGHQWLFDDFDKLILVF